MLLGVIDYLTKFIEESMKMKQVQPKFKNLFPHSVLDAYTFRQLEKYKVDFARTNNYKTLTIPYLQRKLNDEEIKKKSTS
jgi:hypothetical protein